MFEKYKDSSDDSLVFSYKEKKDDDIELELMERYRIHAKKLAGEFYKKFKFLYQLEYEDLYCVAISCLFTAIKTFKKQGFFKMWKTCATNELNKYVSEFTLTRNDALVYSKLNPEELSSSVLLKQNPSRGLEGYNIVEDIHRIINNKKYKFDDYDKQIFTLYLQGYKVKEIALIVGHTGSMVRYRLKEIKDKIADILFNQ